MNNESEFTDEYVLKLQEEIEEYKEIEKSLIKEIDKLTAESTEWEERTYCWQDRAENLQIVLDKIKEYIDKYLYEHIIEDLPDEESKFEKEDGTPIPNAKEEIYKILEVEND